MWFGRKSAERQRIDSLSFEVASLEDANKKLRADIAEARRQSGVKGRMADEFLSERDAARIERDTAQRERDGYREDAIKFRGLKSNLIPGGPYRGKGSRSAAATH